MSTILLVGLALASLAATQSTGICPTPFSLTSTQGTLLSQPDGTQFPVTSATGLNATSFQLTANSTLITTSGASCQFAPWLVCNTSSQPADQVTLSQDGLLSLTGHTNGSTFYACNPAALHKDNIPSSVTLSAMPSTATGGANTSVIEEYYIIPDQYHRLLPSYAGANGSCVQMTLRASECYGNNATTTMTMTGAPLATHTASGASGLGLMEHLVKAGVVGVVLAVFFVGL